LTPGSGRAVARASAVRSTVSRVASIAIRTSRAVVSRRVASIARSRDPPPARRAVRTRVSVHLNPNLFYVFRARVVIFDAVEQASKATMRDDARRRGVAVGRARRSAAATSLDAR
jgi:hypothetical protein